jgi:hypothetical protein
MKRVIVVLAIALSFSAAPVDCAEEPLLHVNLLVQEAIEKKP